MGRHGWMRAAVWVAAASAAAYGQQGAVEDNAHVGLPIEWPAGPEPGSLPEWARPGRIRFARWDGGRLESAKAMLSGWPGFNPPIPDYVDTMTNWYGPRSLELLRQAGVNTIFVTFSAGFSIPAERGNQEQLRGFIAACHREGIRVLAYQSIANLFWEDMFEQEPESRKWVRLTKDGQPTPYGAASYALTGRTTPVHGAVGRPGVDRLPEETSGPDAGRRRRWGVLRQ